MAAATVSCARISSTQTHRQIDFAVIAERVQRWTFRLTSFQRRKKKRYLFFHFIYVSSPASALATCEREKGREKWSIDDRRTYSLANEKNTSVFLGSHPIKTTTHIDRSLAKWNVWKSSSQTTITKTKDRMTASVDWELECVDAVHENRSQAIDSIDRVRARYSAHCARARVCFGSFQFNTLTYRWMLRNELDIPPGISYRHGLASNATQQSIHTLSRLDAHTPYGYSGAPMASAHAANAQWASLNCALVFAHMRAIYSYGWTSCSLGTRAKWRLTCLCVWCIMAEMQLAGSLSH